MSRNPLDKKQGIYVELDALLDTRLGTLFRLDKDKAVKCLDNGYFDRRSDIFHDFPKEVFDEAYKNRDRVTLMNSGVTKNINFIREVVSTTNNEAIVDPSHTGARIILNIYPYKLEEFEINNIIKALAAATETLCDIEVINYSPTQLTPTFCKSKLALMFIYDYAPWLEAQTEEFKKVRCPELTVIVPGIYFVREPDQKELASFIDTNMHPFKQIELVSSIFINLKLHDIEMFCFNVTHRNKKTA